MKKKVFGRIIICVVVISVLFCTACSFGKKTSEPTATPTPTPIPTFTVTYQPNGGSGATKVKEYQVGDKVTIEEGIFRREGYTQAGWVRDSSASEKEFRFGEDGVSFDSDVVLFAFWEINEYTIHFNGNGGTAIESGYKQHDVDFVFPENIPAKKDYTFQGWFMREDPDRLFLPGDTYTENREADFYAKWKLNEISDDVNSGANKLTLSGNREDYFVTEKNYYIEGENYFLFVEKDIKLPGDFNDNLVLIMDNLEKELNLSYGNPSIRLIPYTVNDSPVIQRYLGEKDPWINIDVKNKLRIYVLADRTAAGFIPVADSYGRDISLYIYELFSDDLWKSVPDYRDNPWRRSDHIPYDEVIHELTHVLVNRHFQGMTAILTEGCAEYFTERVLTNLKDHSVDFTKSYNYFKEFKETRIKETLSPDNAESIFISDFYEVDYTERGDEYTLGRMLFEFMEETYEGNFLNDYLAGAKERDLHSQYSYEFRFEPEKHAQLIKDLAGEDVFVRFGEWYQKYKK